MKKDTAHILVLPVLKEMFSELTDCLASALEKSLTETHRAEAKKLSACMGSWLSEADKAFQYDLNHDNHEQLFLGLLESGLGILNENINFSKE